MTIVPPSRKRRMMIPRKSLSLLRVARAAPGALLDQAGDGLGRVDCDGAGDLFVFDMGHALGVTAVDGVGKEDFSTTTSGTEFGAVSAAFYSAFWGRQSISRIPRGAGVTDLDVVFALVRCELSDVEKPGEKGAARRKLPHCGDNVSKEGAIRSSDDTFLQRLALALSIGWQR
jgi:hypothetical protein